MARARRFRFEGDALAERWVRERREDAYWRRAKREGYRSRAAFKLKQIAARYALLRRGDLVVDLGCSPGGWTQAALEIVGQSGGVVGVDLARFSPLPPARFVRGDMTDSKTLEAVRGELRDLLGIGAGGKPPRVDTVISDMSPNISGVYSLDQARSVALAGKALAAARALLRPGGRFCVKVFEGEDFHQLLKDVRASFAFVKVHAPEASRKQSSEVYIVAKGFRRAASRPRSEEE